MPLSRIEPVPDVPYGFHQVLALRTELRADAADMDVNRPRSPEIIATPNLGQQGLAGEDATPMGEPGAEAVAASARAACRRAPPRRGLPDSRREPAPAASSPPLSGRP